MKISQLPTTLVVLELDAVCDIDGCYNNATVWLVRSQEEDYPEHMPIWSLCDTCLQDHLNH